MIRREDLPKLIKILQDKYDSTKEGDIVYDLNLSKNISSSDSTFVLPEFWAVKCNTDMKNNWELSNWRKTSWLSRGYIHSNTLYSQKLFSGYTLISMDQFIEYVYKKGKQRQ